MYQMVSLVVDSLYLPCYYHWLNICKFMNHKFEAIQLAWFEVIR